MPETLMDPITGKGVELRQLVGKRAGAGGVQEIVRQPVDLVYVDNVPVATIARQTNAPLCMKAQMTREECLELHAEVTKLRMGIEYKAEDAEGNVVTKTGRWIPRQDGRKVSRLPSPEDMPTPPGTPSDEELMDKAREALGIDPTEEEEETADETEE